MKRDREESERERERLQRWIERLKKQNTWVGVRHDVPLPPSCPECGGRVRSTGMATQIQEELPVPRVLVRELRVALGACQDCGQRVRGRHRLQTSDALGAAAVQLGPALVASAVILNKKESGNIFMKNTAELIQKVSGGEGSV